MLSPIFPSNKPEKERAVVSRLMLMKYRFDVPGLDGLKEEFIAIALVFAGNLFPLKAIKSLHK